jgi:hypothetical protein
MRLAIESFRYFLRAAPVYKSEHVRNYAVQLQLDTLKSATYEEWAKALSSRFTHGNTVEKVVDDTRKQGTI